MPFFQPAFFAPVQADNTAFANLFQLLNDVDAYQRNVACETTCKPKQQQQKSQQQQQQQQQIKAKPQQQKIQQKIQEKPQEPKPQESQTQLKQQQQSRNPLEDFFNSIQQSMAAASEASRATSLATFSPRFDVRETQNTYELHGELAGVDRNNISLEFTEPQTLVVSGKVERNYSSSSPAAAVPSADQTPEAIADTHSEPDHDDDADHASTGGARTPVDDEFHNIASPRSPSPARSHRATVVDEETEEAIERGIAVEDDSNNKKETAVVSKPAQTAAANTQQQTAAPTERYWHRERSVGQFKRVFTFPVPVDESNVRASLENGILSVSVPKIKRATRRIPVF